MITIYAANATDFSTLGLGALAPSECTIEEQAGGLYEMTLTQPITDDLKHTLIAQGRIIKAPAPVRETPLVEIGKSGSVVRRIYKVTTDGRRLNMRTAADQSARVIHAYRPGTEVAVTGEDGSWSSVIILDGGASGWMWTANLTFVREESETISGDAPGSVIAPRQTREQLFRICEVETDGESRTVTARAQHITYDLKGAIVAREYAPENVSAETVCAAMMGYIDHETPFRLTCTVTAPVTIDCTGRNILDIIMDRDSGLLAQTGARLIRDNYDLFILPDEARDRGVSLRYGKNLLSAVLRTDASGLITRIQPAGKAKDGETLLISDDPAQSFVDSPRIGDYPAIYAKRVEYDVVEGKDLTKAEAREKLREKALSDFDAGCDLPSIRLDADFVRLDLTEDYKALANAYALHLYDSVPVTDDAAGIAARARMTGYKYDALLDRYDGTTLGELTDAQATVYGDEIGGGLSGTKIISGSMGGDRLRNLSVAYAKISRAAVDQLSADSLTAQIAYINALTADTIKTDELTAAWAELYTIIAGQIEAGTITANKLTAAMAKLTKASVEHAEIDWANISKLTAAMANIATAKIGDADIDFAQIKQLKTGTAVADQLITHDAVADRYFIDKLQVRALQVLEQTVGSLTVKAKDGNYYRLDIDPEAGTVVPTLVMPSDSEKAGGMTGDKSRCIIETDLTVADLAATNVKAINALIDKLTASRIEVDTLFAREAVTGALDAYLVRASTIEALEGQLNVWANEKVSLAVGALVIGGTNLIRGTRKMTAANWYGMTGTGKALVELDNDFAGEKIERSGLTSAAYTSCYAKTDNVITAGRAYILTADSYIDPSGTALDGNASLTLVFYSAAGANLQSTAVRLSSESPTGAWQRLEVKATAPENAAYAQITMMLSKNGNVTFARLKLEEGNKATAWSPAPEDTDDSINSVKSELSLVPGEISAAVNNVQVGGTNLVRLGALAIVNASGRAAEQLSRTWYRESEHQTTILPYSGGACWLNCPNIYIAAGKKYTLSYYAWIQPDAESGANKFRPNLFGGTTETDKYLTDFIAFVRGTPTKYTVTFDTTGWAAGDYALRFVMLTGQTHEVYFTDIKLEEGNKATAWSPSPNEVRIGSNILLDLYHTLLKTPYFEVDVSGENGDFRADENGLTVKVGTFEQLYCPEIVKYYAGAASVTLAAGSDLTIISDALRNRILPYTVTITLAGDVTGRLTLAGMSGCGNVIINAAGHTLNGCVIAINNAVGIEINNLTVSRALERQCVNIERCASVKLYQCVFNGNGLSNGQGVRSSYSRLFVQGCEFYNLYTAFAMSYGAELIALSNKGAATEFLWADGMTGRFAGTRPSGAVNKGNPSFLLPADPTTLTIDTGSVKPVETPVTTASFTASTTGTYYPSGHWINDNIIRQGHEGTGSNGRKDYGCIWFGASALSGKTIKSATLTIKRIAGKGRSSSVAMKLWTTTVTGKSGTMASSTLTSLGEIGTIANGETVTVSIPTSAISTIAAGGGLVLYTEETSNKTGKTYSENYAHFEGTDGAAPVLTVTYQ